MTNAELTRLALAVLLQAPFAFRLGYVVPDGREFLTGSLLLTSAVPWRHSPLSSRSRYRSGSVPPSRRSSSWPMPASWRRAARRPLRCRRQHPPATAPSGALPTVTVPDPVPQVSRLLSGMAFLADLLTAADRIGELRQRRRLRKLERQQAERQSSGRPAPEVRRPPIIRVRPTRGFPKLPPPK